MHEHFLKLNVNVNQGTQATGIRLLSITFISYYRFLYGSVHTSLVKVSIINRVINGKTKTSNFKLHQHKSNITFNVFIVSAPKQKIIDEKMGNNLVSFA